MQKNPCVLLSIAMLLCVYPQTKGNLQAQSTTLPVASGTGQTLMSTGPGSTYVARELSIDPTVVYVSKSGNDANSGLSWQTAKLTVAGAIQALPKMGTPGAGQSHYGLVTIGPGLFTEAGNLEVNVGIHYVGASSGLLDVTGTTIQLANNANVPLFSFTPDFKASMPANLAFSHYVSFENMNLDGNYQNNSNTSANDDLIDLAGGGYNTYIKNVTFQNARRYGLYVDQGPVNLATYSATFGNDQGGAVYVNAPSAGVLSMYDTELDNDGPDAIIIHAASSGYAGSGLYTFINLKSEGTNRGMMNHVIRYDPYVNCCQFPDQISVIGGWAYASGGDSYAFVSNPTTAATGTSGAMAAGSEPHWNLQDVMANQGYTNGVFHSAKSGYTSQNGIVSHFISSDTAPYEVQNAYSGATSVGRPAGTGYTLVGPDLELSADVSISGGGNPSGIVVANPGSLFLDRKDGVLWIKQSGTGNTGWTQPGQTIAGTATAGGFSTSGRLSSASATVTGTVTAATFQETLGTPSSSSAQCTAGQFTDDSSYHYVCTAVNTWRRTALSSF